MKRLFFLLLAGVAFGDDHLVLRNQSEIAGAITADDGETVTIRTDGPQGVVTYPYDDLALINGLPAARIRELRREVTLAEKAFSARGIPVPAGLQVRSRSAAAFAEAVRSESAEGAPPLEALAAFGLAPRGPSPDAWADWRAARRHGVARPGELTLLVPAEDARDPFAPFWVAAGARPPSYAVTREYGTLALDAAIPAAREAAKKLAGAWSDAELAFLAARTGVASAVALDALLDPPGLAPDQGDAALDLPALADAPPPPGAPAFLAAWRSFAERDGARFARTAKFAGGWRLALRSLDDPPASTEQILHPLKYFVDRDAPSVVTLADLNLPRGAEAFGYLARGTMGEALTLESLRHAGGPGGPGLDEGPAREAAAGWDGDAWIVWIAKDGSLAFAWGSAWDAPEDARQFGEAAATAGVLRGRGGKQSADGTRIRFENGGAHGVVEWKDRQVVVVEGMPSEEAAATLAETAWKGLTVKEELSAPVVTAPRDAVVAALSATDALAKTWTSDPPKPEALGGQLDGRDFRAPGALALSIPEGWEPRLNPDSLVLFPKAAPGLSVTVTFHRLAAEEPPALVFSHVRRLARPEGDAPFLPYLAKTADGRAWCQFTVPNLERRIHVSWCLAGKSAVRVEASAPPGGAPDAVKKELQAMLGSVRFEQ